MKRKLAIFVALICSVLLPSFLPWPLTKQTSREEYKYKSMSRSTEAKG